MVYIEDRLEQLEKALKTLQEQVSEMVDSSDKKRKLDQVTQDQLDTAVEEVKQAIDKKMGKDELEQAVEVKVKEVMEKDAFQEQLGNKVGQAIGGSMQAVKEELGKRVGEERLAQATHNIQIMVDQKVNGVAQTMQAISTAGATKVTREQLSQAVNQAMQSMQANFGPKLQASLQASEGLRLTLQANKDQLNHLQAVVANNPNGGAQPQWRDINIYDQSPFDVFSSYRVRVGDGASLRWLYSTDVSMGQIYTSCNILDQAIVVNANNKSSYGARRVGADVTTTSFFAVLQLQCRVA
jgi:hypothetical protein